MAAGAETIRLGDDAAIAGDLRYGGELVGNTDAVAGEIAQESTGWEFEPILEPIATWLFALYTLGLNLLLGAALLLVFPGFPAGLPDGSGPIPSEPTRRARCARGVPILLVALAITIVRIPVSVFGGFAFALAIWIAVVYGRYAVAAWLLSLVDVHNRWVALLVGVVAGALVSPIPYLGGLVDLFVLLLGLGALARGSSPTGVRFASESRDPRKGRRGRPGGGLISLERRAQVRPRPTARMHVTVDVKGEDTHEVELEAANGRPTYADLLGEVDLSPTR